MIEHTYWDSSRPPVVLTIDDDRAVRESFRDFLVDEEFIVHEAESGRRGLEVFEQERPDLVLLDLRMAGVNGLDVLQEVNRVSPDTPTIVISGTGAIGQVVEALRLGAWDYLLKPVTDLSVLRHSVIKVLERGRLIRENRRYQRHLEEEVAQRTEELRKANTELRLAATTFQTHEGIFITDAAGTILRANDAFSQITGYDCAEVVGRSPALLNSGRHDEAFYRAMWDQVRKEGRWQGEIWNRRKNRDVYPQWLSVTAVADEAGETTHFVGAFVDLTETRRQQETIERTAAEEQVLAKLLRLSLQPVVMKEYLEQAVALLVRSVPWLGLLPRGAVFFNEPDGAGESLKLYATYHMDPTINVICDRVPFGRCLCGLAAQEREIQFAERIDHRHVNGFPGMSPHGHFSVPILSGERLTGVLVLYLPEGHKRQAHEEDFLRRVADVFSVGIARRHADAELEFRACHDLLTGLPNRRSLMDRLERELAIARRGGIWGALLFLDLDYFKTLNDSMGHTCGDMLITQVGVRITQQLRAGDFAARLGGDEFVVLAPTLNPDRTKASVDAWTVAEKLRVALAEPYIIDGQEYHSTPSVGIVLFPKKGETAEDVLKHADTAMYRAKEEGRNSIRFYLPSMQAAADSRLGLEKDLRRALEREEFELYYQPQVDGESNRITGVEALLRWNRDDGRVTSPIEFIPLAEETGLILPLGEWVLRSAVAQIRQWSDAALFARAGTLAVNISPRQFRQADLVARVQSILADASVAPSCLTLELTEGVLMTNLDAAVEKMQALRTMGVSMSIDDFGTGYSSLSYLKRLPLTRLKIDRSFVKDIPDDPNDVAIVDTIIAMARHLGLAVIAEGVETLRQLETLKDKGCPIYQGYFFSPPVPAADFARLLAADEGRGDQAE